MKNKKLRITEKDFLLANRRASRAEEIEKYGKQISMRSITHKSKKVYDRNRLKKAGIKYYDDLPLLYYRTFSQKFLSSLSLGINAAGFKWAIIPGA